MTKCSIIIPVYNHAALTRQCLDKLLAEPPRSCAREIIVVDDGSSDSTPQMLASYGDRIRAVMKPNGGFSSACNSGAAAATGDYLVFLNNDTIPLNGWLDALVQYAIARPQAGVVGNKLLYPNGTIQHAGTVIMRDRYPRHVYHGFPSDHPAVNKSRCYRIVTGACMLLPRGVFDQLSGFDPVYRNGYEDHDLCLRAGDLGYEVHYCHDSVVIHLESVSDGRNAHADHNAHIFNGRWRARLKPDDYHYYFEDGLLQLDYQEGAPLQLKVSPLLAAIEGASEVGAVHQLLTRRAMQVHELLRENILLRVENARLRGTANAGLTELIAAGPKPVTATPEPVRRAA